MSYRKILLLLIAIVLSTKFFDARAQERFFYVIENGEKTSIKVKDVKKMFFPEGQFAVQTKTSETFTFDRLKVGIMGFEGEPQSVETTQSESAIRVFPNPVADILTIESNESLGTIRVYDLNGKEVEAIDTQNASWQIDLSGLTSGIYFVKTKKHAQRIIKR